MKKGVTITTIGGIISAIIINIATGFFTNLINETFNINHNNSSVIQNYETKESTVTKEEKAKLSGESTTTKKETEKNTENLTTIKTRNSNEFIIKNGETFVDNESGIVISVTDTLPFSKEARINLTCPEESSNEKFVNLGDVIKTKNKGYLYKIIIKEISEDDIKIIIIKDAIPTRAESALDTIIGEYEGSVTVREGTFGIKLNIYVTDADTTEAKFSFLTIPGVVSTEECFMKVKYNKDSKTVLFNAYKWIDSKNHLVDLRCKLDEECLRGELLAGSNYPLQEIGKKIGEFTVNKK